MEKTHIDIEDYLWSEGLWDHTPQPPYPREGFIGETVFADEWTKMMRAPLPYQEAPNSLLANILNHLPRWPRANDAKVCASVVCWLGTSCGWSVVDQARRFREFIPGGGAMLASWALDNERRRWLNGGIRTLEGIMAKPEHLGRGFFSFGIQVVRRPRISADTYEVVEHLMRWLGGEEGLAFIARCERIIEELNRLSRIARERDHQERVRQLGIGKR